jgi:hypothetical protein
VVVEPSVEDWDWVPAVVGFDLVVAVVAGATFVRAVVSTSAIVALGLVLVGTVRVAPSKVVVVALLGAVDWLPFFLFFIMVDILWE